LIEEEHIDRFSFGRYNNRELDPKQVKVLQASMVEHGVQWFKQQYLLPLLVPSAEYLEPTSYTTDITVGPKLPELLLSAKGKAEYPKYIFASGQHRVHALVDHRQALEESFNQLHAQEKEEKLTSEELPNILDSLKALDVELKSTKYWGVAIYNESESNRDASPHLLTHCLQARLLQNGRDACVHLSRNTELVHYGETDVERIRVFMTQVIDEPDASKHAAIRETAGVGNLKLKDLMKGTGSFAVLKTIIQFRGGHFLGPSGLSANWLHDKLLDVSGGVSFMSLQSSSCLKHCSRF
jgi:hypothetical protein